MHQFFEDHFLGSTGGGGSGDAGSSGPPSALQLDQQYREQPSQLGAKNSRKWAPYKTLVQHHGDTYGRPPGNKKQGKCKEKSTLSPFLAYRTISRKYICMI